MMPPAPDERAPREAAPGAPPVPDISIVIACHDAAVTLPATLHSLVQQTHANWEAICVDDGSTDQTAAVLRSFAVGDPRLRPERLGHVGQPAAKNYGLRLARARWVMILDADDVLRREALNVLLSAARATTEPTVIAPGYELMAANGCPLGVYRFAAEREFNLDTLVGANRLGSMSLVPRAVLPQPAFDEDLPRCIDWNLWLKLAQAGVRCCAVPRALVGYRLHTGNLTLGTEQTYACARRIVGKWAPQAPSRPSVDTLLTRLAISYGAMAWARGDRAALANYWSELGRVALDDGAAAATAGAIDAALLFIHGARGVNWRDDPPRYVADAAEWISDGPLRDLADDIVTALGEIRASQCNRAAEIRQLLVERPDLERVVVYGLGRNGAALVEQLRRAPELRGRRLHVADDHIAPQRMALTDLRMANPADWTEWPAKTLVVVTPQEAGPLAAKLARVGGRADHDYVTPYDQRQPALDRGGE